MVLKKQTRLFWEQVVKPETELLLKELKFMDDADFSKFENYFGVDRWFWAMSIISSRSAMVPRKGLVIPIFADMFNHKSQPSNYAVRYSLSSSSSSPSS